MAQFYEDSTYAYCLQPDLWVECSRLATILGKSSMFMHAHKLRNLTGVAGWSWPKFGCGASWVLDILCNSDVSSCMELMLGEKLGRIFGNSTNPIPSLGCVQPFKMTSSVAPNLQTGPAYPNLLCHFFPIFIHIFPHCVSWLRMVCSSEEQARLILQSVHDQCFFILTRWLVLDIPSCFRRCWAWNEVNWESSKATSCKSSRYNPNIAIDVSICL